MAARRAVAASIASAVIFSSILLSNYILYSGAQQNFWLVSVATEERASYDQSFLVKSVAVLDLLDGAQELLSSGSFACSNASATAYRMVSAEEVKIGWDGFRAGARLTAGPDATHADNLTALRPFSGSAAGWMNFEAMVYVEGGSADGMVNFSKGEGHLLNLPLRLQALTETCLSATTQISSALRAIGSMLCNASVLASTMESLGRPLEASAASAGFSISITYGVVSTQTCQVEYRVQVAQDSISGPEGSFTFSAAESGSLSA